MIRLLFVLIISIYVCLSNVNLFINLYLVLSYYPVILNVSRETFLMKNILTQDIMFHVKHTTQDIVLISVKHYLLFHVKHNNKEG